MREQFELLPEIKNSLSENIVFIGNKYTTADDGFYELVNWLNGAWYVYQARQDGVDQLIKALEISAAANFISDACSGVKELKDLADENRIRINGLKLELKEKDKRIVDLEKRINKTIKALESDLKYVEGDFRGNHEFLKLAMIRCLKEDIDILAGEK